MATEAQIYKQAHEMLELSSARIKETLNTLGPVNWPNGIGSELGFIQGLNEKLVEKKATINDLVDGSRALGIIKMLLNVELNLRKETGNHLKELNNCVSGIKEDDIQLILDNATTIDRIKFNLHRLRLAAQSIILTIGTASVAGVYLTPLASLAIAIVRAESILKDLKVFSAVLDDAYEGIKSSLKAIASSKAYQALSSAVNTAQKALVRAWGGLTAIAVTLKGLVSSFYEKVRKGEPDPTPGLPVPAETAQSKAFAQNVDDFSASVAACDPAKLATAHTAMWQAPAGAPPATKEAQRARVKGADKGRGG